MKTNFLNKKFLCGVILLLFLALMSLLILDGYLKLDRVIKIYSADAVDIIDQRMSSILSEVNIFPQFVGNDLIFLNEWSSLKKVVSSGVISKDLENDFLKFIKQGTAYYQLGYLDNEGNEILKLEYDGRNYQVISREELGNKRNEDYFIETIGLDKEEVFISKLYLDTENGETKNNPTNVPFILSATPVFDKSETLNGIVFLSVYANYFLDGIRNAQREGESVFLIDKEGNYLAHPIREKEFGFLSERKDNFYIDYSEIPKEIVLDSNVRRFEYNDLIFSFRRIYPTEGDFAIHKGSEKVFGEEAKDYYLWIMVSVSEKEEINRIISDLKQEYLYFLFFSGIISVIIIVLIFIAVFRGLDNGVTRRKK